VYHERRVHQRDPNRSPPRVRRAAELRGHVRRARQENREVYGVHKVWQHLGREGRAIARCTAARLMRPLGGVVRGRRFKTTTRPGTAATRPLDLVTRQFAATRPNQLWVADLTYVATWRGFAYVAFVIDVFARRILGWRVSSTLRRTWRSMCWSRRFTIVHSPATSGSSIVATAAYSICRSGTPNAVRRWGSGRRSAAQGDSYDNALAESVIGLYKTEEIHRRGPWRSVEDVEFDTLEWVAWYNTRRLLERLGYMSPDEFERAYYDRPTASAELAALT
jgi:putative transposase